MEIISTITDFDRRLLSKINGEWHNSALDRILPLLRESKFWIPFYFFLLIFVLINFGRKGWYWCLSLAVTASVSDLISSRLVKGNFFRLRPCRDEALAEHLRFMVKYCPVSSSFTSSHAVTHFAMAMFIYTTFRHSLSPKWIYIFFWAAIICYAQVYVGVHYPTDVICGALLGLIIGYLPAKLFNKHVGLVLTKHN